MKHHITISKSSQSIQVFHLVGGCNPSEKYEFVSWDYSSQYMESHKIHVPNHQAVKLQVSDWVSQQHLHAHRQRDRQGQPLRGGLT